MAPSLAVGVGCLWGEADSAMTEAAVLMGRWMCRWWKRLFPREVDSAEAAWCCQWGLVTFGVAWIGWHLFVHLAVGHLRREIGIGAINLVPLGVSCLVA